MRASSAQRPQTTGRARQARSRQLVPPVSASADPAPRSRTPPSSFRAAVSVLSGARSVDELLSRLSACSALLSSSGAEADIALVTAFHRLAKLAEPLPPAARSALIADARCAALGAALSSRVPRLSARSLSNLLWAQAKLGHGPAGLLASCAAALRARAGELSAHEAACAAWALATAATRSGRAQRAAGLLAALAPHAAAAVAAEGARCDPRALSQLAWALGAAAPVPGCEPLAAALAAAAQPQLARFSGQGLCNLVWGLARVGAAPSELLSAAASAAAARPAQLAPRDAAAMLHACALAGGSARALGAGGAALLDATRELLRSSGSSARFDLHSLSSAAWALAALGVSGEDGAWPLLAARLAQAPLARLPLPALASLAWAAPAARYDDPGLMDAVAAVAAPRLRDASPRCLAQLAQAMGSGDALASRAPAQMALHAALLDALQARAAELSGRELANAAWGLAAAAAGAGGPSPAAVRQLAALRARLAARAGELGPAEAVQMHQAELLRRAEAVAGGDACGPDTLFPALFDSLLTAGVAAGAGRAAWERAGRRAAASRTQEEVAEVAAALAAQAGARLETAVEHVASCDGAPGYSLDIAWPSLRCALEVDGPTHYFANSRRPTGATQLKRRLLAAAGWRVASLPVWAWDQARGAEERRRVVRAALEEAGVMALLLRAPPAEAEAVAEVEEEVEAAAEEARGPARLDLAHARLVLLERRAGESGAAGLRRLLSQRVRA